MEEKAEGFTVNDYDTKRVEVPIYTGSRQPFPTVEAGFRRIDATCNVCGTRFRATRSRRGGEPGRFFQGLMSGGNIVTLFCSNPECENQATVKVS